MSEITLPTGWASATFEEVLLKPKADLVDGPFGSNLKSAEYVESGVPVLKIQNIKADRFVRRRFSYVTEEKAMSLSRHSFVPGDLMITKLGDPLGLCCEVPKDFPPGIFVADLMRLRLRTREVSQRYVLLVINSQVVQAQFKLITKGTTRPRVNLTIVRGLNLPLPPLNEQKRIVAKIEELFSELEAGEESFRQARRQLGVYRQSLLKQAFEGKLTAAWRQQNPHLLESPDQLLHRIQTERQKRYEEQMKEWDDAAKASVKSGEKKLPKPKMLKSVIGRIDIFESSFPAERHSMNLSQIALELGQGWSPKCESHAASADEWGVMKTTAIQQGRFQPEASKVLPSNLSPRPWLGLRHNDILITRAGPRSRCGVVCRVDGDHPKLLLCDKAYRLAFSEEATSAKFIELLLCSPVAADAIEKLKTGINDSGVNITQTSFLQLAVPLPSLPEQQEIVRLLDEQFTVIAQNEREIDAALKRSEALRQSILKKAFSGQLVPQDPTDEPASELLARIRSEREKTAEHAKSQKKAAKKKTARKRAKKS